MSVIDTTRYRTMWPARSPATPARGSINEAQARVIAGQDAFLVQLRDVFADAHEEVAHLIVSNFINVNPKLVGYLKENNVVEMS